MYRFNIFHPFKTYYNQGQHHNRRRTDSNPDRYPNRIQNRDHENQIDIKTDPNDGDYHRDQNQYNHGQIREKWSGEVDQDHHRRRGRNDFYRGRGRHRGRGSYRGGRGHYHGKRRGNSGYGDGQNHGCNNSSEQDVH